jgi:ABC-2 type transport system permease protein
MVIPENFYVELNNKHPKEILTIIDGTNTLIANNIMAYVSNVTGTYGAGVMLSILEANGMTADAAMHTYNTFQYVERTLYDPYMSYLSYLLYFIMPYLLQMTVVCIFALPMFSALRVELMDQGFGILKKKWLEVLVRCIYIYLISAFASWTGFCLADKFFGFPIRGTMGNYFILLGAFELALYAAAMILATFIRPKYCLYFFEVLLSLGMVILLTNGAIWLPYLMPEGLFRIVGCIWPFAHVALPFKYLNLKGSGLDILLPGIWNCLKYAAFWGSAAIVVTILQRQWHRLWQKQSADA